MKFLLAVVLVATVQAQDLFDWEENPYDNRDFNVRVEYGDDLTLLCNDSRVWTAGDYTVKKWILPDLEIMYPNDNITFQSLDGPSGWSVNADGKEMEIMLVQEEHFGPYYCIAELTDDQTEIVVKVGLNMWGPDYGDLWAKYKDAVGWASGLTAAFIAVVTVAFIMYTRNEEPENEDEDDLAQTKATAAGSSPPPVFENKAYTGSNGSIAKPDVTIQEEMETSAL